MCFDKADMGIGMKSETTNKGLKELSLIENKIKVRSLSNIGKIGIS